MFAASNIIAGLEIGTSKICVVVGEQKRISGATQFLNVDEILSASFEVAKSIAKSA